MRIVGTVAPQHIAALGHATRFVTLEDVLRWGGDVLDVVVQDEYTHDVIVTSGTNVGFLVFDTT